MKKMLLFLVLSFFLFNSCNKSDSPTDPIEPTAPPVPTLSSPANNATSVAIPPTLTWNASTGAASYTLQVSTSSSFTSFAYNQSGLTGTSQQVGGLSNNTKYYWRVNATNSVGTSDWSTVWNFTTIAVGTAPPAPTLSSPVNNAANVAIPPTLSWNASTGAASYTLQVSTSSAFGSFVYNQSGLTGTSQQVTGLNNNTKYYWRVNATNSVGTSAWSNGSNPWNFTIAGSGGGSSCAGVPTVPYGGKTYTTVQIGNQCWLKENLDVGVYVVSTNTGSTHSDVSNNGVIEKYCYDNNPANCNTYGGLYDWNEAMAYTTTPGTQGICPPGWHIPTLAEFEALKAAVNNDGNALKSIGQGAGTNTSGFSALLSGYRSNNGGFSNLGYNTYFWSSTECGSKYADYLGLYYDNGNFNLDYYNKGNGFSVRCVKD